MDLLSYTITLALVSAAPGPVVTILVLRGLSGEVRGAMLLCIGLALGQVAGLTLVVSGLGLWLSDADPALMAAKALGIGYLSWIAVCLWHEGQTAEGPAASTAWRTGFTDLGAGVAISLSNPLTLLFFVSLLPALAGPRGVAIGDIPRLALLTLAVNGGIHAVYVLLAARFRFLLDPRSRRRLRRSMAALLGCATLWLAVR